MAGRSETLDPENPRQSPKPRLALRVGVTGHRGLAEADQARFAAAAARVLRDVRAAVERLHAAEQAIFSEARPLLRLVSSLAEGADQITAEAALAEGYALQAPLPFARAEYEKDFKDDRTLARFRSLTSRAEAVFELAGDRHEPERAYEAAGYMALRASDLLIALWDGRRAAGRGGTAEIVQAAVDDGIPVVWITPVDATTRLLERGPFSRAADARDLSKHAPEADAEAISRIVDALAAPPGRAPGEASQAARVRLDAFLAERPPMWTPFQAHRMLQQAFSIGVKKKHPAAVQSETFRDIIEPFNDALPEALTRRVRAAFRWTDRLATHFGEGHRSASITNFSFAALAVGLALIAVLPIPGASDLKPLWVSLELAVIFSIGLNTVRARRGAWHDKWLDYRALSEHLRVMRMLALTGSSAAKFDGAHLDETTEPGPLWTRWYYRALVREIGMPNLAADEEYRRTVARALHAEFQSQVDYHHRNTLVTEAMDERLEKFGEMFLVLSVVAGLGFLAVWGYYELAHVKKDHLYKAIGSLVTFIAGFFPAIGAAVFGIREQAGFERRAALSEIMAVQLAGVTHALEEAGETPRLPVLSGLVEEGASIMTVEVADWGFIFRAKPLALPG